MMALVLLSSCDFVWQFLVLNDTLRRTTLRGGRKNCPDLQPNSQSPFMFNRFSVARKDYFAHALIKFAMNDETRDF